MPALAWFPSMLASLFERNGATIGGGERREMMKLLSPISPIASVAILLSIVSIRWVDATALHSESPGQTKPALVDGTKTASSPSSQPFLLSFNKTHWNKTFHLSPNGFLDGDLKSIDDSLSVNAGPPGFAICDPAQQGVCKEHLLEVCRQVNGNGVYRCLCPENISRTSHGKCTVFNECFEKSANNCSENAECLDLEEGYSCKCKDGFRDESPDVATLPGRVCAFGNGAAVSAATVSPDLVKLAAAQGTSGSGAPAFNDQPSEKTNPVVGENRDPASTSEAEKRAISLADAQTQSVAAGLLAFQSQSNKEDESKSSPTPSQSSAPKADEDNKQNLQPVDTQPPPPELSERELKEIFRSFDLDRNELVAFWELKSAVDLYQLQISDRDIRKMIKIADNSGEGFVDFVEFTAIMTSR